ncbi:MAG: geranylgeranylglycerol-phosphate geranylgeranyltransferase [Candidatus Bathyarchaeia archaeon]
MDKFVGYLRLIRPLNCIMMGCAVIVGAALASPDSWLIDLPSLTYGFITGFMLTAASMSINDYYDREIDAVNEPNRPIPSGVIKPNEALAFACILTSIGFISAYLTDLKLLAIALASWIIFVTYTTIGKLSGLPGNFLVSACVTIPFIYGSFAVSGEAGLNVLVFVLMVFLSNTGREITKGIVDVQGDSRKNVKTLAVRYGGKKAALAASSFYVSAIALSPIPWFMGIVNSMFIPLVGITDLGLLASSIQLIKDYSREEARRIKNRVLLWFIFGLLAFILGVKR